MAGAVPFLDLTAASAELGGELERASTAVLRGGRYVLGPEVEAFEREFAAWVGARHAVGVSSGTDAIALLLRAWGIGPGDEVLVPAMTAIATWMAVTSVGARPVGVDVEATRWAMDPAAAAAAIGPRTRAIVAVHLYGQPADTGALCDVAAGAGVPLLEDCAQAHGARQGRLHVGNAGTAAAFSFYPTKNLGALGDAGAVTTGDEALAERLSLLRTYGWRERDCSQTLGVNARLDELQAALLRVKLRHLEAWNARRAAHADAYRSALDGLPGLGLPRPASGTVHAWHLFVVRHAQRDRLRAALAARGIGTGIHYGIAPHLTPALRDEGWRDGDFPVAEALAATALSLPLHPQLGDEARERVITALREEVPRLG